MFIGHEPLVADMQRLAREQRLAHGYLLFGKRRVGKATFGKAFAAYLESGNVDWDVRHPPALGDLCVIAPNEPGGSIGIDAIRSVRAFLSQAPNRSPVRTIVIDDAEQMTTEAENAFLKIAEEPNPHALLFVAIDDPERLLPTLRSRLQAIHFGAVPTAAISAWLLSFGATVRAADDAARSAHGAPGAAWRTLFDADTARMVEQARSFLALRGRARADFIKNLVGEEWFSLEPFLEALVRYTYAEPQDARSRTEEWHELLELRRTANLYNLNARLQLTSFGRAQDARS